MQGGDTNDLAFGSWSVVIPTGTSPAEIWNETPSLLVSLPPMNDQNRSFYPSDFVTIPASYYDM